MLVTEEGMVMLVRPVQPSNALSSMLVTVSYYYIVLLLT